jgi:hypothetical protein
MNMQNYRIAAATVNHNTSAYMELMLRSFFQTHATTQLSIELTVFDNTSTDETENLAAYLHSQHLQLTLSGWHIDTHGNSHGHIFRDFVLSHPNCTHYLFLDPDVVFIQNDTIVVMLHELETSSSRLFGIGPRLSWDGVQEIPLSVRQDNPDICDARLHPCCALIQNTPTFRNIVEAIGLSCATHHWADKDEFLDTFKLMTRVMQTHNLRHQLASVLVRHFFCVSYDWDSQELRDQKAKIRDQLLQEFRNTSR